MVERCTRAGEASSGTSAWVLILAWCTQYVARPPMSASLSRPAACYRGRKSMSMAMQATKLQISEQILAHGHGAP